MAAELDDLWQKLSLAEECTKEVVVEEEWVGDPVSNGKYCLLGKLIINRASNLEAMRNVLAKAWRLKSTLTITEVGEKVFVFQFEDAVEKDRVLLGQPWTFNKSLLVLNDFDSSMFPEKVNMNWCPFWVQVHGLPLDLMNEKIGIVIGETIGEIMEVETDWEQQAWGRWLRIRVNIDVSKPLKRGSKITRTGGGKHLVAFRYEKLPDFCYMCGKLNHQESDCHIAISLKKEGKACLRQFGPWLRADGKKLALSQHTHQTETRTQGSSLSQTTGEVITTSTQAGRNTPNTTNLRNAVAGLPRSNVSHTVTKVGSEDIVKKDVWYEKLGAKQVNACDSFNVPVDQNCAGDQSFSNNSQADVNRLVVVLTNMEVEGKSPLSKPSLTITSNVDQVSTSGASQGRESPKNREWAPQDTTEEAQPAKPPPPCLMSVTPLAQGDLEGPALEKPKRTWKRAKGLGTKDVSNMVTAISSDLRKRTLHEEQSRGTEKKFKGDTLWSRQIRRIYLRRLVSNPAGHHDRPMLELSRVGGPSNSS
ncbi:hypothetical protein PTKIN_Ptkin12aG0082300 [Pterospermum kingtungense]